MKSIIITLLLIVLVWSSDNFAKGTAVTLYNANCTKSSALGSVLYDPATGAVTTNVTGATPDAAYFVAVRYNPASLVGTTIAPPNPTAPTAS